MKKSFGLALVAILGVVFLSGCIRIEQGYVGIKAWELGAKKGEIETFSVGRWSKNFLKASWDIYPTFKQNYVWTADRAEGSPNDESFSFPIEGLVISIDVGIEFSVDTEAVTTIYAEYRKTLDEITDGPMRNYVRDSILEAAKGYANMEQFITGNLISDLIDTVEQSTIDYFRPKGIIVSQIYLVNAPRYPTTVTAAIEEKIKATQRAIQRENELRETEAAAAKQVAEAEGAAAALLATARAEAESKQLLQKSYTKEILQAMWIEKWDGKLPEVLPGDSDLLMALGSE